MLDTSNPEVSIILPTYNGATKYLKGSIESCLTQTFKNWELIVVDDGSKDATADLVRSFHDPRIIFIQNKKNLGLPMSLNVGFEKSKGAYVTWTSDDNQYLPSAVEDMLNFLKTNPEVGCVYTDCYVFNYRTSEKKLRTFPDDISLLMRNKNYMGPCFLYRRSVYKAVGNYNPNLPLVEDYDYWIRILQKFKMAHLAKPLYIYGDHEASLTVLKKEQVDFYNKLLRFKYGYLDKKEFREYVIRNWVRVREEHPGFYATLREWLKLTFSMFKVSFRSGSLYLEQIVLSIWQKASGFFSFRMGQRLKIALKKIICVFQCSLLKKEEGALNVLCLIKNLSVGGSQKVVGDLISGMPDAKYTFHLLVVKDSTNQWIKNFCSLFSNVVVLDNDWDEERFFFYLETIIRKLDIKLLLISYSPLAYRTLPLIRQRFPDLPIIDILHLDNVSGTKDASVDLYPYLNRRVCISERLRRSMKKIYQDNRVPEHFADRLLTIHNGINPDRKNVSGEFQTNFRKIYNIGRETKLISFIGRFAPEKNPLLFVKIAHAVLSRSAFQGFKFVMAGEGKLWEDTRQRIEQMGIAEHFILPGVVADVENLLSETFLLLVTSNHEGIPLVIQEALKYGVPVISTEVGAVNELIREKFNGHIVVEDEHVVEKFSQYILRLASDQASYKSLAENTALSLIPEFTLNTMGTKYRQLFDDVLR